MALQTSHKWIIAVVAIAAVVVIVYFLTKSKTEPTPPTPPSTTTTTNPGLVDQAKDIACKIFPKLCGKKNTYTTTGCDPNRPGWNNEGLYDVNCQ